VEATADEALGARRAAEIRPADGHIGAFVVRLPPPQPDMTTANTTSAATNTLGRGFQLNRSGSVTVAA